METISETNTVTPYIQGSPLEVLRVFLKLGLTCFGGPVAHIGYFRDEFVVRRKWIDEHAYADLVGLCQFLPGPASSKVGFSIGLMRAGYAGGLAAWTGFTLPSAALLVLFAYGAGALQGPIGQGLLHGLKLTAVAIVAQAVWGMARNLCPDRERASIAVAAALLILLSGTSAAQIGAIVLGGLAGLWLCRSEVPSPSGHVEIRVSRRVGLLALTAFVVLLVGLPVLRGLIASSGLALFDAFYRSGALVFGGGHVVLPLLRVSQDAFLAELRRRPGGARPTLHVRRLSGDGRGSGAVQGRWRRSGPYRHLPARDPDPSGSLTILGFVPETDRRPGRDAGRERRGRGRSRRRPLRSGLDLFRAFAAGLRRRAGRLRSPHRLAGPAAGRCRLQRRSGHDHGTRLKTGVTAPENRDGADFRGSN
jgi:chromate transport protein ChrA